MGGVRHSVRAAGWFSSGESPATLAAGRGLPALPVTLGYRNIIG